MQMGARELLMHYMDLKQTNDVQLTFEALKVKALDLLFDDPPWCQIHKVKLYTLIFLLVSLLAVPGFSAATQEVRRRVCGSRRCSKVAGNPQAIYGRHWSVSVPLLPCL